MFKEAQDRQTAFQENWPMRQHSPRWEVHINSLGYSELKRLSLESFK